MDLSSAIATTLKKYRETKNLSQEELAFLSGIDRTYISLIERSKRKPTVHVIYLICQSLDIRLSEFFLEVENLLNK